MQYRPSGRAEDHEAGPVGAPGVWPVRPATNASPGTFKKIRMRHRTVTSYVFCDMDVRYRIIAICIRYGRMISYNSDMHVAYRMRHHNFFGCRIQYRMRHRIPKWQEVVQNIRHRTFYMMSYTISYRMSGIRYRMFDIRCRI